VRHAAPCPGPPAPPTTRASGSAKDQVRPGAGRRVGACVPAGARSGGPRRDRARHAHPAHAVAAARAREGPRGPQPVVTGAAGWPRAAAALGRRRARRAPTAEHQEQARGRFALARPNGRRPHRAVHAAERRHRSAPPETSADARPPAATLRPRARSAMRDARHGREEGDHGTRFPAPDCGCRLNTVTASRRP
jgi:hypothetical protein